MFVNGMIPNNENKGWLAGRAVLAEPKTAGDGFTRQMQNAAVSPECRKEDMTAGGAPCADKEEKAADDKKGAKSKSDTEVVTNPDGSKVLLIKTYVGGMETLMSIELSKPSPLAGEQKEPPADTIVKAADRSVGDVCDGKEN